MINPEIKVNDGPGNSIMGINLKLMGGKFKSSNKEDLCLGANQKSEMSSVKTVLANRLQQSTDFSRCDQERKDLSYR